MSIQLVYVKEALRLPSNVYSVSIWFTGGLVLRNLAYKPKLLTNLSWSVIQTTYGLFLVGGMLCICFHSYFDIQCVLLKAHALESVIVKIIFSHMFVFRYNL